MKKYMVDVSCTLFHHGHTRLLQNTREMMTPEDKLVVCLTTDQEVLQAKGYLPELNFDERKEILLAIKGVDEVIPGPWLVTDSFMDEVGCDFLVHGEDNVNKVSPKRTKILPRTHGVSSYELRERTWHNQIRLKNTKTFLTPGPAALHHAAVQNIGPCFGFGDETYLEMVEKVQDWILSLAGQDQLIASQGSASFSIEMGIKAMAPKQKVLVIDTGFYSQRMALFAEKAGFQKVDIIQNVEMSVGPPQGKYDWVLGTYVEPDMGRKNDIHLYAALAKSLQAKLFLDATASIGLEASHHLADCVAFSSCKGLLGLTGGSFLAFKNDANLINETDSWYQSIKSHKQNLMTGPYHVFQSLSGIMEQHADLCGLIQKEKKRFLEKVRTSALTELVTEEAHEPLLCTMIKGNAVSFFDADAIHYEPRNIRPGFALVCHLSSLYAG